jgi:hypothetical protein
MAGCTLCNQPLKMGPTEGSETSANHNMTPEKYPEEHTQRKLLFTFVTSVRLSAQRISTGLICVKFDGDLYENLSRNSKFG